MSRNREAGVSFVEISKNEDWNSTGVTTRQKLNSPRKEGSDLAAGRGGGSWCLYQRWGAGCLG